VLRRAAWNIADQLGWLDTFVAEYIALPQLQADALVCVDLSCPGSSAASWSWHPSMTSSRGPP